VSMTRPGAGCLEALLRDSCEGIKWQASVLKREVPVGTLGVNKELNPV
jgi:hypothetical protein